MASYWLSALPMKATGYALNKQESMETNMHEIWMEGKGHTNPLCLWKEKFCESQHHMHTGWLHYEAQLSKRL